MRSESKFMMGAGLLGFAAPAFSQQGDSFGHFHGHMWDSDGWVLGPILMLLVFAAIIAIVYFVFKQTGALNQGVSTTSSPHKETPLDALKMRFANGQIDQEDYELRRKALES